MEIFEQLGREFETRWRAMNYDESAMPALAADVLREADVPSRISAWDVTEWALATYELPRQRDLRANFADPPITVFSGLRFQIDVYFWFEATTAIHQHAFSGAFQVLLGSSIHSWYEFERERSINGFTETGKMNLKVCELLNVGDVHEIIGGRSYIHALFHLDRPSATLIIRTDRSPIELPQFSYHKPHLAVDPFLEQDTVIKKIQVAGAMLRASHDKADECITRWLDECDAHTAFQILREVRGHLRYGNVATAFGIDNTRERFDIYIAAAEQRHGEGLFRPVFDHIDRLDEVMRVRSLVGDPELRFFVALLLNVEGRERIYSLIKSRYSDDEPMDKVLDWTYKLANTRIAGTENANALGMPDFGDIDVFVLEEILNGRSGTEIADEFRKYHGEPTAAHALAEKEERIRNAAIFAPLLV